MSNTGNGSDGDVVVGKAQALGQHMVEDMELAQRMAEELAQRMVEEQAQRMEQALDMVEVLARKPFGPLRLELARFSQCRLDVAQEREPFF